jgi:hypothetical protein
MAFESKKATVDCRRPLAHVDAWRHAEYTDREAVPIVFARVGSLFCSPEKVSPLRAEQKRG